MNSFNLLWFTQNSHSLSYSYIRTICNSALFVSYLSHNLWYWKFYHYNNSKLLTIHTRALYHDDTNEPALNSIFFMCLLKINRLSWQLIVWKELWQATHLTDISHKQYLDPLTKGVIWKIYILNQENCFVNFCYSGKSHQWQHLLIRKRLSLSSSNPCPLRTAHTKDNSTRLGSVLQSPQYKKRHRFSETIPKW